MCRDYIHALPRGGEEIVRHSWGQEINRKMLLDLLADVSPDETPLLTLFGSTTARGTLHEWLTRAISRPASVTTVPEGYDPTYADLTAASRVNNITQISSQPIAVSRTERKVDVAGTGDPWAFHKADALRQLKLKMEYAVLNAVKASGSSGAARQMDGVDAFITTLATARNSGTSFSETELNDMTADAYNTVSADKIFDMVLCTVKIKQAIAGFSGNSTRYIDASDRRLVKDVLVYDSAVGSHRVMHHRDVRNTAGTTTVYGLREDMHKVAYLDKPFFEEYAKTGDAQKGQWVTEYTLEVHNEKVDQKRTGYNLNG